MARWKLATAHYLNIDTIDGTKVEWEYQENDRKTNRPKRHRFPVPMYLDPKDPTCWTNTWGAKDDLEGEIIVCTPGTGQDRDITFHGDPTPDMIPLDDEARALSASFEHHWSYKPDTDTPGDYSQSLIDKFQSDMAEVTAKPVEITGMTDLVGSIGAMMAQNQKILEALVTDKSRRL